jgi:hypothetical protein
MSVLDVLLGALPDRSWAEGLLDGTKIQYITAYS